MDIVIIDDDKSILDLLSHVLTQQPSDRVFTFPDPSVALAWCAQHEPDLVVVDYMMPEMDGLQFIQSFRWLEGRDDVPLLMLTADQQTSVRHQALKLGANDFVNKPLDIIEIAARISNMLALRHSQKKLRDRASWLAEEVAKATSEICLREHETIIKLSRAAEYRDPETGTHILRMAHYSRLIARNLGMDMEQQQLLMDAAPMHDIGKVGIPDHILLKPSRLTEDEMLIMRQHTRIGYSILSGSSSSLLQMAAQIALSHHEKYDGSGYPYGLVGEDIPISGRIVAVADVYDALSSERPYKTAWMQDQVLELLRECAGKHFDPRCVDALLSSIDEAQAIKQRFQDEAPYSVVF